MYYKFNVTFNWCHMAYALAYESVISKSVKESYRNFARVVPPVCELMQRV